MRICSNCGSKDSYKNGTVKGQQRYVCRKCKKSFGGGVHSQDKKNKAIYLYIHNMGIRHIGRICGVSSSVVINWIKKAGKKIELLKIEEEKKGKGEIDEIELDEIYTYVKKNLTGCSYGLLIAGKKSVLLNLKQAMRV